MPDACPLDMPDPTFWNPSLLARYLTERTGACFAYNAWIARFAVEGTKRASLDGTLLWSIAPKARGWGKV